MCDNRDLNLKTRHSFSITESSKQSTHSAATCKSDLNVALSKEFNVSCGGFHYNKPDNGTFAPSPRNGYGEYYKRYEHDEMPVKDSSYTYIGKGDKGSLTNSDLDKLEMKIFKNVSQELQTEESSMSSLESNIKFFRTTVQEIFDNFYTSMQDFELYKKRFHEILAKNNEESIADMEEFIKDMIQNIMSSETSISNDSRRSTGIKTLEVIDKETNVSNFSEESSTETYTSEGRVVEAYKNENYLTDSTLGENAPKVKRYTKKEEIFNIYLLNGTPCVQIKMNDRNLLSEINIKEPSDYETKGLAVSADNLKRLAAKKLELEQYITQQQDNNAPDREFPVKISYAKKNIYLNEDFAHNDDSSDANKSIMSKICNFLCKKLRKSSFV